MSPYNYVQDVVDKQGQICTSREKRDHLSPTYLLYHFHEVLEDQRVLVDYLSYSEFNIENIRMLA
jgi:hypothetical protein